MRCCNADGLVLRPDVSATEIDKYFVHAAGLDASGNVLSGDGEVWVSTSQIGDSELFRYYYVFAVNLDKGFLLYPGDVDMYRERGDAEDDAASEWLAFESNTTDSYVVVNDSSPLSLSPSDKFTFEYYCFIPLRPAPAGGDGYYLQGEVDKWIGVSRQRFKRIEYDDDGAVSAEIVGVVGETVVVAFVKYPEMTQTRVACKIGETLTAVVRMPDDTCTPY